MQPNSIHLQDFTALCYPAQLAVSPGHTRCAWLEYSPDLGGNCYQTSLVYHDFSSGNTCRAVLIKSPASFTWKDENHIAYLASNDKQSEIRLLSLTTGADTLLCKPGVLCKQINSLTNGRYLLTVQERCKTPPGTEDMILDEIPFWFNGQGYTNGLRTRLYLLEIAEGSTSLSPVSPLDSEIGIVSVHDNEIFYSIRYHIDKKMKFAALCRYDSVLNIQEQLIPPDIYDIFYAARVGSHILVCATDMKQYGNVQNPAFYCINDGCLQMIADPDLGVTNDVTSDARYGSCSQWCAADDQLFFIAATRQGSCLYCISGSGAIKQLTADNGQTIAGVSVCGSVAAVAAEWPDRSGEICQLEGQNDVSAFPMELKRISHCNDSYFSTHQISIPEHFNFQNNNMELDGFVLLPAGFQPGHSYPGVLQIHGGPKLAYGRVFHHEMQAMAAKGWFVFYCNPRGSDGRGSSFMDIRGSYGDGDYSDLMAFTDEILKRYPEVDPGRLAVCGGSYGGFMVNWIIGHTNRFCCAIAQRSISNWFSMFCAGDTGYRFVADQLDGTPWTQGERFWNQSPLCYADKVQTPTLFIHSDLDYRCNMLEGFQMFTALKYFGVETRLCLLRGENHELSRSGRPRQRIRRLEEMFQWLDKHFK